MDTEATWPASKEKPVRYLGVAHNVGDVLTFLVYDEASRFVLARSVLRPAENYTRVTWDPNLQGGNRLTAKKDISARRGAVESDLTNKPETTDAGSSPLTRNLWNLPSVRVIRQHLRQ